MSLITSRTDPDASIFSIHLIAAGSEKTTNNLITRISTLNGEWYGFPEDLQDVGLHKELIELPVIKAALKMLKRLGIFRTVNVKLPDEIGSLYYDNCGNFIFGDSVLPVLMQASVSSSTQSPGSSLLQQSTSEHKEGSIKSILKHFLVEKFTNRSMNVRAWLLDFERECARFDLSGAHQLEVLKSCLDTSLAGWFKSSQKNWLLLLIGQLHTEARIMFIILNFLMVPLLNMPYVKRLFSSILILIFRRIFFLQLVIAGLPKKVGNKLNFNLIQSIEQLFLKLKVLD